MDGVYADYATASSLDIRQGRFITDQEVRSSALVVVLDEAGVKNLFGSAEAQVVGQTVRIGSADYEIVGVTASTDTSGSSTYVSTIMPYTTCAQRVVGTDNPNQVIGIAREDVDPEKAAKAAKSWIVNRYQISEADQETELYIATMKSIMEQLDAMVASFQLLMTAVASISLLVGGIGIMNMMLTNVTERIREIGLRKALGARRRDITRQFLLESVCITLAGGVFGVLLGLAGSFGLVGLVGDAMGAGGLTITPTIGLDSVAMVAGICILIGVVFGYYPAHRAARLDPVESLRYQ